MLFAVSYLLISISSFVHLEQRFLYQYIQVASGFQTAVSNYHIGCFHDFYGRLMLQETNKHSHNHRLRLKFQCLWEKQKLFVSDPKQKFKNICVEGLLMKCKKKRVNCLIIRSVGFCTHSLDENPVYDCVHLLFWRGCSPQKICFFIFSIVYSVFTCQNTRLCRCMVFYEGETCTSNNVQFSWRTVTLW